MELFISDSSPPFLFFTIKLGAINPPIANGLKGRDLSSLEVFQLYVLENMPVQEVILTPSLEQCFLYDSIFVLLFKKKLSFYFA